MNKFTKAFRRGEKGFTLIELLIVIVILGILAAVAIPQVTKFIRQGKVSAANSELALVNTAIGAGMADAQVSSVTSASLSSGADFQIDGTHNASSYIQGGIAALKGTYTIGAAGVVTAATYPGVSAVDATHPAFY